MESGTGLRWECASVGESAAHQGQLKAPVLLGRLGMRQGGGLGGHRIVHCAFHV